MSSLYASTVPVFEQMLTAHKAILHRVTAHIEAKKIDPNALLDARLFPDMFSFAHQVQIACDFARGVSARLAGIETPKLDESVDSFDQLHTLIDASLAFIKGIDRAQIDGKEDSEIVLRPGTPKERRLSGQSYVLTYGLPQFFFHVTTAYAILRHNGLEIGKADFMGTR